MVTNGTAACRAARSALQAGARLRAWMRSTPSAATMRAMARALASSLSGFLVASRKGDGLAAGCRHARRQAAAGLGQHQGASAGTYDGLSDLDRGQLRAAGIELRDDLQYGRPVFRHQRLVVGLFGNLRVS